MKRNQILIILSAAVAGLLIGYFVFSPGSKEKMAEGTQLHADEMPSDNGEEQIWTCSMHPQIRQNEPGLCPICGMELIPLELTTLDDPLVFEMTPEAVRLADIQTTTVGEGPAGGKQLILSGKIQADERYSASQVAHVPGRIEKLFVTFTGEQIYTGQKLATIYSPELITAQEELFQALQLKDQYPELLEAARNKLTYWKIPAEEIRAIEERGEIRETFTVKAEVSGVVTGRRVSVGDYVRQGQVLFDIVNLDRLWVIFDAYEEDLAAIKIGDKVRFTTPAVPARTFTTTINFIDPVINSQTRVAAVRGEVGNRQNLLKPQMFVRGTLQAGDAPGDQVHVPASAVLWTGKRSVVYLKETDTQVPAFRYREIVIGERIGDYYVVESGLKPGEEVVTQGSFTIDAAVQLNNQQSMMNRLVSLSSEKGMTEDYRSVTPDAFKTQFGKVVQAYLKLKDNLVETDPHSAASAALQLLELLNAVDMELLTGDAHLFWMQQQRAIETHARAIGESDDIEKQRAQFAFLSDAIIRTVSAVGVEGPQLYVQHCPMAIDDDGADWLSAQEEILNPYFGEKMLKCGYVTQMIPDTGAMEYETNNNQQLLHQH